MEEVLFSFFFSSLFLTSRLLSKNLILKPQNKYLVGYLTLFGTL